MRQMLKKCTATLAKQAAKLLKASLQMVHLKAHCCIKAVSNLKKSVMDLVGSLKFHFLSRVMWIVLCVLSSSCCLSLSSYRLVGSLLGLKTEILVRLRKAASTFG